MFFQFDFSNICWLVVILIRFIRLIFYLDVRLCEQNDCPGSGRVQVLKNGIWTNICSNSKQRWDVLMSNVVCRQLGYPGGDTDEPPGEEFRLSKVTTMKNVVCSGLEKNILSCQYEENDGYCQFTQQVFVNCNKRKCKHFEY